MTQITDTVLMIRPSRFGFNEQTAATNYFQKKEENLIPSQIQNKALNEFDNFADTLRRNGIHVIVAQDSYYPCKPDSIFPNNWFSTTPQNELYLYPMLSPNRRDERNPDIIKKIENELNIKYNIKYDLVEKFEAKGKYLEGTGSLVLDHKNKVAYAAISPRTHIDVLHSFCKLTGYEPVYFSAYDYKGQIYHTNVMMSIAVGLAIISFDTVDIDERESLRNKLTGSELHILELSAEQVNKCFAGNMLQLKNKKDERFMVMSQTAKESLTEKQLDTIEKKFENKIIASPLDTIEKIGGGSARCMLAEIFYTK